MAPQSISSELYAFKPDVNKPKDMATLAMLYQRLSKMPYYWDDTTRANPYLFAHNMLAANTAAFILGDPPGGIIYINNIYEGNSAGGNIAVWDRKYLRRQDLVITAAKAAMVAFKLHRLDALILVKNTLGVRYAQSLGFRYEGTLRERICYNGRWEDVVILGVLEHELGHPELDIDLEEDDGRLLRRPGVSGSAATA